MFVGLLNHAAGLDGAFSLPLKVFDRLGYNLISWIIRHFHFPWYLEEDESSTRDWKEKKQNTWNLYYKQKRARTKRRDVRGSKRFFTHLRLLSISFQTIKSIPALVRLSPPCRIYKQDRLCGLYRFSRGISWCIVSISKKNDTRTGRWPKTNIAFYYAI